MTAPAAATIARRRLLCRGTVQGVGFRPAVYRLAAALDLGGWVRNDPEGATIEIEGPPAALVEFAERLPRELPSLARLGSCAVTEVDALGETRFTVRASRPGTQARGSLPADAALCAACRADMERPGDRRFRFPFTTCSNCGPRFSIVQRLPYDRAQTAMACFPLCPECAREYADPADRRFHAEPLGCPECGPRLWLADAAGRELAGADGCGLAGVGGRGLAEAGAALDQARAALAQGRIVALKGLGGFQLACRADQDGPVAKLRERKRRLSKPFAVMARDLAVARRLVALAAGDEALLGSAHAPILLAPRRAPAREWPRLAAGVAIPGVAPGVATPGVAPGVATPGVATPGVAPGLSDLGVMLPTTPLHIELFRGAPYDILVMTSGNVSDEPIACGNREAIGRLAEIADLFLLHDRDVVRRLDDSVARTSPRGPFVVRRSRGYVPRPLPLPEPAPRPVLALGGHLQATACLALGDEAVLSQHVGDLDSDAARGFLREAAQGVCDLLQARPETLVVDQHPDYPSTWLGEAWAREARVPLMRVQHHLAHAAAVLSEHRAFPQPREQAAAIVLDGTGWGPDGTAWGGECLLVGGDLRWRRVGHLAPFPLVGGERAVREPWRVALALLAQAQARDVDAVERIVADTPLAAIVSAAQVRSVAQLSHRGSWPMATGAGRLCEAAGALLGLAAVNGYEGEAAALCEAAAVCEAAASCEATAPCEAAAEEPTLAGEVLPVAGGPEPAGVLPAARLLAAVAAHWRRTRSAAACAAAFHATFCRLVVAMAVGVVPRDVTGVALGGGCFVNRLLRDGIARGLEEAGFTVWLPREVPPGDGGLAYGQAALAAAALARGREPRME